MTIRAKRITILTLVAIISLALVLLGVYLVTHATFTSVTFDIHRGGPALAPARQPPCIGLPLPC